jgi:hypothetical protein
MLEDGRSLRWMGMDMRARWRRRMAVVLTYLGYLIGVSYCSDLPARGLLTPTTGLCALSAAVVFLGIFRDGGLVKPLHSVPQPAAWTERFGRWLNRVLWRRMRLPEVTYEAVVLKGDESMEELRETLRTYRLDERELMERNQAFYWALSFLGTCSVCGAVSAINREQGWSAHQVTVFMLENAVMMLTLPAAIVLWRAADPRAITGEMEMVEREV